MTSPRQPGPGAVIRATLLGNLWFTVSTFVLGIVASIVGWIPPRGDRMFSIARWWSRGVLATAGVRLETSGLEALPPDRGYVFMANHESLMDIPALIATLPTQTRFLAKSSLFRIPIFGWALHAGGFVPVDRGDRVAARGSLDVARARLESGRSILVFPEGTRSTDGELLRFRRGGFVLALDAGFPIVPIGLAGTGSVRPRGSLLNRPGTVRVRYGRPVDPGDFGPDGRSDLTTRIREEIDGLRRSV